MTRRVILRGPVLSPVDNERATLYEDGAVTIDAGRIEHVGAWEDDAEWAGSVVATSALILPAFVDAHVHLPQIDVRGRYGPRLLAWLERYVYPAEIKFGDPDHAASVAARFFDALGAAGIGTASVFATVHTDSTARAFEIASHSGLRIVMGKVLMDRNAPDDLLEPVESSVAAALDLAETWEGAAGGRVFTAITPRFAPTSSPELLAAAGSAAAEAGLRVQTHLAEQRDEIEAVARLFPEAADYLAVYERAGLVSERSIFAHAVYCSDDAFRRLARSGASVACCPTSNAFLGSGSFPMPRARSSGVHVAVGCDVGAGPSFSPLDVLRHYAYLDRASPADLLYRATRAGAEALGFGDRTGRLEPGMSADLILLEPPPDADGDPLERFSQCVFRGDESRVLATLVEGSAVFGALPDAG